jgi:hypothetical protein
MSRRNGGTKIQNEIPARSNATEKFSMQPEIAPPSQIASELLTIRGSVREKEKVPTPSPQKKRVQPLEI